MGKKPEHRRRFRENYVEIGRELNALPKERPKYVVVAAGGVEVRGVPMPSQTVMFVTDTFTPEKQKEKNIFTFFRKTKIKFLPALSSRLLNKKTSFVLYASYSPAAFR